MKPHSHYKISRFTQNDNILPVYRKSPARSQPEYWNFGGCWKTCRCKAREILRNEAYINVRCNEEG